MYFRPFNYKYLKGSFSHNSEVCSLNTGCVFLWEMSITMKFQ